MANWKLVSARVTEETYNAMKFICEKEKIKPNKLIRVAVEKRVQSTVDRDLEKETFPTIGENVIEYNPENETFSWFINFGDNKPLIISNDLGVSFIENLQNAIRIAVEKKKTQKKKIKKKQTFIPSSISKFRSRE